MKLVDQTTGRDKDKDNLIARCVRIDLRLFGTSIFFLLLVFLIPVTAAETRLCIGLKGLLFPTFT